MPLTITTSFTQTHCDAGFKLLRSFGVKDPIASKRESLDPHELGVRLKSAHLKQRKNQYTPVKPTRIGKAWQLAAGEIIIANADQDHWGWADSNILPFLDFWAEFEPDARFALFYTQPGTAAFSASQTGSTGPDEIEVELNAISTRWAQFNDAMMRFYSKHEDRCILVNLAAAHINTAQLSERLASKLEIDTAELTIDQELIPSPPAAFGLLNAAPNGDFDSFTSDILEQLEALADCRGLHGNNRPIDFMAMLAEHLDLDQKASRLENELSGLRSDFDQLQYKVKAQEASLNDALKEKSAENELLLLQLEQVQEELEYQFKQAQDAAETGSVRANVAIGSRDVATHNADPRPLSAGAETAESKARIDLRHFINGMNWHEPEHDGRWAGPGTRSSIRLPQLAKGRYRLTIEIIDAMNRAVFDGMTVALGPETLQAKRRLRTNVSGALAGLKRVRARINTDVSPYPAALEAEFVIDGDHKKQTELFLDFPEAHSPSERGEPDIRRLTVRISHIDIVPA